ncbi:MAG: hypothetical protein ACFB9N_14605 [Geitlerinemataceae cyanobacterium]
MNFFRRRWASWLSLAIAALASVTLFARANAQVSPQVASFNASSCQFNGINLYGDVRVVSSFPDITVKKVTSFPDLNVQWVSSFPDSCGKWKEVSSSADFTIQYVDSFPDIEIEEVSSFPGVP